MAHVHSTEIDRCGARADPCIADIEQFGFDNADRIIAVSHRIKTLLVDMYRQPPGKIDVVHNALPWSLSPKLIPCHREDKTITFVGRVTYQKGPAHFLAAAHIVSKSAPLTRFSIVGDGDLLPEMKRLARAFGIADKVYFHGFLPQDQVRQVLRSSSVYVMPSVSEPFGIACLEAIAEGVPAVVSKTCGVTEVVSNLLQVDYWDEQALADAILTLLEDQRLREQLVHGAYEEVRHLSWEEAAKQVRQVYDAALAQRDASAPSAAALPT